MLNAFTGLVNTLIISKQHSEDGLLPGLTLVTLLMVMTALFWFILWAWVQCATPVGFRDDVSAVCGYFGRVRWGRRRTQA